MPYDSFAESSADPPHTPLRRPRDGSAVLRADFQAAWQGVKQALFTVSIFTVLALAATTHAAQEGDGHEPEFRAFYADFLNAARANDKEKIADMIAFPVGDFDWYVRRGVRDDAVSIKDKAEFLKKYDTFFTTDTRRHLPKAKTVALEAGRYAAFWDEDETRFTFLFEYIEGPGYRVESFTTGARR